MKPLVGTNCEPLAASSENGRLSGDTSMRFTIHVRAGENAKDLEMPLPDYSEEAIPERDPSFRTQDGTMPQEQTVDDLPAVVRRDLARRLQELGMSPTRAALVASL
jgi:hypothetical protein